MPIYEYIGKNRAGKMKNGRVTADHRRQGLLMIKEKGIAVYEITKKEETFWTKDIGLLTKVKQKEKIVFLRQFGTILKAGITVVEALKLLSEQVSSTYFKTIIRSMAEEIQAGHTLSEAFGHYPKVFDPIIINMIKAGETGGRLEESFEHLSVFFERQYQIRQKLLTAVSYPIFISVVSLGVIIFLLTSVIPMFQSMFAAYHTKVPEITLVILSIGAFFKSYGWLLLIAMVGLILLFISAWCNKNSKIYLDHAIIKLPILGQLIYKTDLARVLWMLSLLFESSVPILESMNLAEKVTANEAIRRGLRQAKVSLESGQTLAESFKREAVFPGILHQMTAIGERTGSLETMLENIAGYYEQDVNHLLDRVKALIEPVLMVILSIIVGFVVMAIVIPMFQIYQNI